MAELLSQNQAHPAPLKRREEMNLGAMLAIAIGILEVVKSNIEK